MNIESFNIKDFGARGDGQKLDSVAIQAAFDQAASCGGGTVIIPPGIYRSANLILRDNLTIHLQAGAVIQASSDIKDYQEDKEVNPLSLRHYVIYGKNVRGVTIEGAGRIDGNGDKFWEDEFVNAEVRKPKSKRPVLLYCLNCCDLNIKEIKISNAAVYTVWLLGCEDVRISNLVIRNDRNGPNTDALDIDCCRNVLIDNCDIISGDDCLAIKSDISRLKRNMPCERILVNNCIFSSSTCAIRIGYEGDGVIRDCCFGNLIFYQCAKGVAMQSVVPDMALEFTNIEKGTPIENMSFHNIIMRDMGRAFFIWAGNENEQRSYCGHIKDIRFNNIQASVSKESYIGGVDGHYVSGLSINNIKLRRFGNSFGTPGEIPNVWGHINFPSSVLALRYIKDLKINNLDISGDQALSWKYIANGHIDDVEMPEIKQINYTG